MEVIKTGLSADNHTNTPGRIEEAHRVHEAMLLDWTQRGVDFIGLAGDWNEVPPNERDQAWSRDFLGRCAGVAPVAIVYGNHCPAGSLDEFHLQSEFKYPITVVSQPDIIRVETKAGPLAVACVPFVWKAHLLAQLGPMSPEESDAKAEQALASIFLGLGVRAKAMNLPTVALVHGKWRGSKLNEEQPSRPLGMEIAISDIGQLGAQISNVGHIHLHQFTEWDGFPIVTPSSCFYVDYGESAHKKGYIYAEVPKDRTQPATWEHIPTPVTPMILLVADYLNGAFEKWRTGQKEDHPITLEELTPEGVDFRFRYHYPKTEEKTAKGAAAEFKQRLEVLGAVNVKLDPVPIPAQTTRSLEIVKAKTLTDKARLLWASRGLNLSKEEEQVCVEMIGQLQTEFGFGQRLTLDAGIHFKRTRMRGWRCFPGEVSVDFEGIDGDVVAVMGPNGTGKSLFFEIALLGSTFRELPTHGNIGDHAIARDTFVETEFEYDGKTYTVSQIIDGKDGTGSSSLKIGNRPVFDTETALRTQYDKWVAASLPPFSLVKSTTFMPQESKGILGMGTKERKALILRAKGAERYEILAEAASKRATATDKELVRARGQIEGIGEVDVAAARSVVENFDTKMAHSMLDVCVIELEEVRTKAAHVDKERIEYSALIARRDELAGQVTAMRERRTQIQTRWDVSRELTDQKEVIEKAVVDVGLLEVEIAGKPTQDLELQLTKAVADEQRLESERLALIKRADELIAQEQGLSQRLSENDTKTVAARSVVADADSIRNAVAETTRLQSEYQAKGEENNKQRVREVELTAGLRDIEARGAGNAQAAAELQRKMLVAEALVGANQYGRALDAVDSVKELEGLVAAQQGAIDAKWTSIEEDQVLVAHGSEGRIRFLRDSLKAIADKDTQPDVPQYAVNAISKDDEDALAISSIPARIEESKLEYRAAVARLTDLQNRLAADQKEAARLPELEAAEKTLLESKATLAANAVQREELLKQSGEIVADQLAHDDATTQTLAEMVTIRERVADLASLASLAESLATADTKIQGLEEQAETIKTDRATVRTSLAAVQRDTSDLKMVIEDAVLRTESTRSQIAANDAILAKLASKVAGLKPTADKASMLTIALAAAEDLLHQLSGLDKELEDLEARHDKIESQVDTAKPSEPVDLVPYEAAVTDARTALTDIQTRLAVAEKELKDAETKEGRRQELVASVRGLEKDIDRWNLVERTLGRDGLQAEEIAACGDEINERANELLRACGNTKYTVDLKTTKMTKDGKKEIEGCPINVYNSETGQWQEGSTLSPGQRAFVNLPIHLTLAEIGCKDSSVRPTIYLDEPTASLDPIARIQFVAMMRNVALNMNAKLFFVGHNEELIALADSRILIDAGKVTFS